MPETKVKAIILAHSGSDSEIINQEFAARQFDEIVKPSSLEEATRTLQNGGRAVVLVPIDGDDGAGIEQIETLKKIRPETSIIASGPAPIPGLILRAAKAGAAEFLVRPIQAAELGSAIDRILRADGSGSKTGKCVAIYSSKGGQGNTTLAVNLAFALAKLNTENHIALVDLVVEGGDVRSLLDLKPRYTIKDLAKKTEEVDRPSLKALLHFHPGRVWVCVDPHLPDEGELLSGPRVTSVIRSLIPAFNYTVVDCEHSLTDRTLGVLDLADEILLPTQLTVSCVRSLQRTQALFGRLGYPKQKLGVVVNRYGSKVDLTLKDLQRVINVPVAATIPNDYSASIDSASRGEPIHSAAPKSKLARNLDRLAQRLDGGSQNKKSRSSVRKLFNRRREGWHGAA